jgi:hypothetical protein
VEIKKRETTVVTEYKMGHIYAEIMNIGEHPVDIWDYEVLCGPKDTKLNVLQFTLEPRKSSRIIIEVDFDGEQKKGFFRNKIALLGKDYERIEGGCFDIEF